MAGAHRARRDSRVRPAGELIPELAGGTLLHAGPPLRRPPQPVMAHGLAGALLFEGRAETLGEALAAAKSGGLQLAPGNDHAGPRAIADVRTGKEAAAIVEDLDHVAGGHAARRRVVRMNLDRGFAFRSPQ